MATITYSAAQQICTISENYKFVPKTVTEIEFRDSQRWHVLIEQYCTSLLCLLELSADHTMKIICTHIRKYLGIVIRHRFYSEHVGPHVASSAHKSACRVPMDVILCNLNN